MELLEVMPKAKEARKYLNPLYLKDLSTYTKRGTFTSKLTNEFDFLKIDKLKKIDTSEK